MQQTFVIAAGVRDRVIERFFFRNRAEGFVQAHPARHRLSIRTLDVQHTLWAVHVLSIDAVFCFASQEQADDFIDMRLATDLKFTPKTPDSGLFHALSPAEKLQIQVDALRDHYAIEHWFVDDRGRRLREWTLLQQADSLPVDADAEPLPLTDK